MWSCSLLNTRLPVSGFRSLDSITHWIGLLSAHTLTVNFHPAGAAASRARWRSSQSSLRSSVITWFILLLLLPFTPLRFAPLSRPALRSRDTVVAHGAQSRGNLLRFGRAAKPLKNHRMLIHFRREFG